MSGWGRVSGGKADVRINIHEQPSLGKTGHADALSQVLMLSDGGAAWSEKLGLKSGERTKRYAVVLDDLVVKSVEVSGLGRSIAIKMLMYGSCVGRLRADQE